MADRIQLRRNPVTEQWEDEAEAMGLTTPVLMTADLVRLRRVLQAAEPALTMWEWGLLSHVMDDEGMLLIADRDLGEQIVSAGHLAAAIVEWADGAQDDELLRAEALAQRVKGWSDLERWAVMVRRRTKSSGPC